MLMFLFLSSLFCQPYTFLFFQAICQFVVAIYGHLLCPPLLSTTSVFLWSKQLYRIGRYLGSYCLYFGLQTPYGWSQTILNIFFVKLLHANLHELLIKFILSYHLLWHLIFCLHHSCRFVCARIKYFLSLIFYTCCIFQCLSQKKSKRLRACLVHLLPLVRLVCLPRVARQIKMSSHGNACFHRHSIDSSKGPSDHGGG
jgi:hypothetical protein